MEEPQTRLRRAGVGARATRVLFLGIYVSYPLWVLFSLHKKPLCFLGHLSGTSENPNEGMYNKELSKLERFLCLLGITILLMCLILVIGFTPKESS